MRVSVIIPVYNVEPYIRRCLESVMSQDISGFDLECLLVDDCGDDRSMEIVREVTDGYKGPMRFFLLSHEQNLGLSAARNTGLKYAKGDYVLFIDSDDYLMPGALRYMLDHLSQHPEVDMVIGNVINKKNNSLFFCHLQEPWLMDDAYLFSCRMLRHQIYLYAWNKLIRRSILVDYNVLFIDGILYEDQSWSYQLFFHLSSVLLLPQVTYVYECNPTSIVNTTFSTGKADKVIWSYTVSINYMLDNPPVPERYRKNIAVDYLLFMLNMPMMGVDLSSRFHVSPDIAKGFLSVRLRLWQRALCYGRLLLACFFLLLFPPLSHLKRFSFFRLHFYDLERGINVIAHLTDFLHNKNKV